MQYSSKETIILHFNNYGKEQLTTPLFVNRDLEEDDRKCTSTDEYEICEVI